MEELTEILIGLMIGWSIGLMLAIVFIKEMSAGNEQVGEMWKETKIFDQNATLKEVFAWVNDPRKQVTLFIRYLGKRSF